jgi:invasion protein IalB
LGRRPKDKRPRAQLRGPPDEPNQPKAPRGAEDRANVGLTVNVLKTADQKSRLMRVVAPVGVLLPSGLGLKIDQVDVGRAGFVRCLPNGCVAEVVMDDNLVKQLRTGQTATFIIFQTPEEGIGFPMSLKGFGEGYDKLP